MARKKKGNAVKSEEMTENEVDQAENDCPMLPKKALFRIDEVARYFDVSERTVRIWIEHGHLYGEKVVGSIRVSRESILTCRFRNR